MLLAQASWSDIETLRGALSELGADCLESASQSFVELFARSFESIVLARVFIVLPFEALPEMERRFASGVVHSGNRLRPDTPILALLGTAGVEPPWNDRARSQGHLAIPLISRSQVQQAPMIAKLLSDLEVDLAGLDDGRPIATRRMLGGRNGTFYVPDAQSTVDQQQRPVIADTSFVNQYGIRTVFGMGGAYLNGRIVIAIFFTTEHVERLAVDRYPNLISSFKMATAQLEQNDRIFRSGSAPASRARR